MIKLLSVVTGNDDVGEEKGEEREPLLGLPIITSDVVEREINEQVVPLIIVSY